MHKTINVYPIVGRQTDDHTTASTIKIILNNNVHIYTSDNRVHV